MHAELQVGQGVVGLSSAHQTPGNPWSGARQGIYVHVLEVDAHHDRAKAAGADVVAPLKDLEYGVRPLEDTPRASRGYLARDPGGFLWGFSTYIPAA